MKDFLTRPPSTNFLVVLVQERVFRLPSIPTLTVRQMATRNVGNVLLLRNQIKLTLTAAAGFAGGPVFPVCVSQVQMSVHWVAERLLRKKQQRISIF